MRSIVIPPFEDLLADFDKAYEALMTITPAVDSVLPDEEAQAAPVC
ncbi:hypothetical protein O9992_09595 [Vibrio lentus]|nr:hypothetical protein [Vibrio lentus]